MAGYATLINPACYAGNQGIEEGVSEYNWVRLSAIAGAGNRSSMNLA